MRCCLGRRAYGVSVRLFGSAQAKEKRMMMVWQPKCALQEGPLAEMTLPSSCSSADSMAAVLESFRHDSLVH